MADDPGILTYFRNYSSSDTTSYTDSSSTSHPLLSIYDIGWTIPSGYAFKEWNRFRDGSGTSYQPGGTYTGSELFAIWEERTPTPYLVTDVELEDVADAIRTKGGTSAALEWPDGYADAIADLGGGTYQAKTVSYTPTESQQTATVTADSGYDALSSVGITVNAISTTYIGSGITRRSSSDLTVSGATVTAPAGYYASNASASVSGGGDDGSFKSVIERTATMPTLPSDLTTIGSYAFRGCSNLALTSLPSGVTEIQTYAFYGCSKLALTELPAGITTVPSYAFYNCSILGITNLPSALTRIDQYAFYGCNGLTSISGSGVTYLNTGAFLACSNLASASFPAITTFTAAFGSAGSGSCPNLTFADIGKASSIPANAFANCYKLQTLVLRKTGSICTLANVSAFLNTPMRGYNSLTGTVYVPSARIATYKTATNWKTLYDGGTLTFAAIEGSQYEL